VSQGGELLDLAGARAAAPFPPIWPNLKAIRVGYLAAMGYTSHGIADQLADGTSPETIRSQLRRAGIHRAKGALVPVHMSAFEIRLLNQRAAQEGMAPTDWLHHIAAAAARDDLFRAIVDR